MKLQRYVNDHERKETTEARLVDYKPKIEAMLKSLPHFKKLEMMRGHGPEWKVTFAPPNLTRTMEAKATLWKNWLRGTNANRHNLLFFEFNCRYTESFKDVDSIDKPFDFESLKRRSIRCLEKTIEKEKSLQDHRDKNIREAEAERNKVSSLLADVERELGRPIKKLPKNISVDTNTVNNTVSFTVDGLWPDELATLLKLYLEEK